MKNLAVELVSQTASFRNPDFQNFHKSLHLPPPTTIVGLSGAALGLSPMAAQEFFEANDLQIGVHAVYAGKCSDTWKYNKGIRDMRTYNPAKDGSIIQKEYLIHARFVIAFFTKVNDAIEKLADAFETPKYALTMGNSDSLACVKNIELNLPHAKNHIVENCLVQGDVINNVIHLSSGHLDFSIYHTSDPIAYDLPVKFNYASDYGKRVVSKIGTYSMIARQMKLNYAIEGLQYKDIFVPMLSL